MTGDELDALEALPFGVAGGITDMPPGFGHETEEARRRAIVEIVEEADRQGADADGIADALLDEADRWAAAREPAGAGLRTPSDALRPFLRHEPWCNCKTDDDPDTQRCKCGLRAALVSPAEPGLDVERLRWAKWISDVGDTWPIVAQGDWACAECRPTSDLIEPGWRCVIHEARAALSDPKP